MRTGGSTATDSFKGSISKMCWCSFLLIFFLVSDADLIVSFSNVPHMIFVLVQDRVDCDVCGAKNKMHIRNICTIILVKRYLRVKTFLINFFPQALETLSLAGCGLARLLPMQLHPLHAVLSPLSQSFLAI